MNRSTNIKSRVLRNLKSHNLVNSDIIDEEIYDEIGQAQNRIISDVFTDKIVTITLVAGQDTYLLTTDDVTVILTDNKKNIASVKIIKIPSTWTSSIDDYGNAALFNDAFNVIPNKDFVDYVNTGVSSTGQPRVATIIEGKLKLFPVPTSDYDGDQIELYTYLGSSAGVIDKDTIPEIPDYFDKSMELFATAQFLIGQERVLMMSEFEREVSRVRPIPNRKHHNLQRQKVTGW